jgi:hypothetical protein
MSKSMKFCIFLIPKKQFTRKAQDTCIVAMKGAGGQPDVGIFFDRIADFSIRSLGFRMAVLRLGGAG